MRTFFIETWGCQMNHHDSERLDGLLRSAGLEPASAVDGADLVLLNTCSVREKPVQKITSRIGELERFASQPVIGVCGCVAQQEGEGLLKRSKSVGFVLGPGQVGRIREAIRSVSRGQSAVFVGFDAETDYNYSTIFRKHSTRGMVTVIEGCNEFCTFCIVPYTRGREVSRTIEDVVAEVRSLTESGIREIELLGQTINAYTCPDTGARLADLLRRVATIDGADRVRFITSHPRHFDDDLIQVLADHPNVSRYLHLPFQAGSNRILKRMNRKYTREEFLELIRRIRSAVPDINLSTDVIVGFPGEAEEDFQETLDLLEVVRFGQVYAFGYSPRPKTPSRTYDEQVADETKSDRLQRLFAVSARISGELNSALVGTTVPVLVDGESRKRTEHWQGRGEDNRVVNFPKTGRESVGDVVPVIIERAGPHSLFGRRDLSGVRRLPVMPTALTSPDAHSNVEG
jgi:tRNA-2-methylthio-N6-dimethylallyladenosine synthase